MVYRALQWLIAHNQYYHTMDGIIDATALAKLPQDGSVSHLLSVTEDYSPLDSPPTMGEASADDSPTTVK